MIANNFLLTRQHGEKVLEVQRLMQLSPAALREDAQRIDYVFIRLSSLFARDENGFTPLPLDAIRAANPPLANALTEDSLPEGFELIDELRTGDDRDLAFARLLRVIRSPDGRPSNESPGS